MSSRYNMYTIRFDGAGSSLSGENVLHSASEDPAGEIIKDATEIIESVNYYTLKLWYYKIILKVIRYKYKTKLIQN